MRKFLIRQIAKQYRARITVAKNVQLSHLTYMFSYSNLKLVKTYLKALSL